MPKRKATKPAAQKKTGKGKKNITGPIVRLVLVIIAAGLIYWFWPEISNWVISTWESAIGLLGIGLAFIVIALGVIIWIIWQGKFSIIYKHWNVWLGSIAFAFAAWGLAAFFSPGSGIVRQTTLGGTFGQSIISNSTTIGILKLIGLIILGIIFVVPKFVWRLLTNTAQATKKSASRPPKPATVKEVEPEEPALYKVETREAIQPVPGLKPPTPIDTPAPETWEPGKYQPVLTTGGWQLPPISVLDKPMEIELSQADIEKRAEIIEEALASYGVEAKIVQINVGPTVTQFGVEPGWDRKYKEVKERDRDGNIKVRLEEVSKTRVKVDRISSLASDLALALAAPNIRIEAPIPGKSMVGIEVPNTTFGLVNLRSVMETPAFQKISAKSKLAIALGKGAGGEVVAADLARMPHLLIAGATGSGKTACINSIITGLLIQNTPDDAQFLMIDPKRVELINFDSLPHLIAPVVVETDKAVVALRWLTQEMDNRYRKFAKAGARNIEGYNKDKPTGDTMPYIVLFIDELADLMMASFDEVEHTLCRLAQLARATGIHLIVATQRPSVDVVTGLIKANFPTRISFALTSQVDSRTILDTTGAEKLLGRGDMLFMPTDAAKPKRLQGTFTSDTESDRIVHFWSMQKRPDMEQVRFEEMSKLASSQKSDEDSLIDAARQLAQEHKGISTSFLQRRLRIGYPRAARLFDQLEAEGYIKKTTEHQYGSTGRVGPEYPDERQTTN